MQTCYRATHMSYDASCRGLQFRPSKICFECVPIGRFNLDKHGIYVCATALLD